MMSTDWDVESYRSEFESEEHWELRKTFMLAHKDTLPEDEVVCLAQVFTNIELLGCRYPEETMRKVAELAKGIVESYRERKKNCLKRTFIAASDAAVAKVKGWECLEAEKENISYSKKQCTSHINGVNNMNCGNVNRFIGHEDKINSQKNSFSNFFKEKRRNEVSGFMNIFMAGVSIEYYTTH